MTVTSLQLDSMLHAIVKAAIYIRVSTKNQEKGYSLETQLEGCLKYCQEHGYIVEEQYIYRETMTGVVYRERAVLNTLREAARNDEFDAVVVYDVDRFSRDPIHQLIISDELSAHGVRLESVIREIDDSDEGKLVQYARGYAAKLEYERLKDRSTRGIRGRVNNGKLLAGGSPLYGYQWADKSKSRYLYHPQNAPIIARIMDMLDEGWTERGIAAQLNKEGIATATGKGLWKAEAISRIAHNLFYSGRAVAFKKRYYTKQDGKHIARIRPIEEQTVLPEGVVPPIVSQEKQDRILNKLEERKQRAVRNNKNPEASLLRQGL